MKPGSDRVVSLRELLVSTLALRREASMRYRRLAASTELLEDAALRRLFSRLAVAESEFAARIERDLPDLDVGTILAERVTWTEAMRQSRLDEPLTPGSALEAARRNERRMRAVFEHLAATSPHASVRMRSLESALAETRHLSFIEQLVTPLSASVCAGRDPDTGELADERTRTDED
jgi:rubrerythrin